jgi:amino acid transporter
MGVGSLFTFGVGASSPMTVVAGGIIATYATTGIVGVPLSFLVLGVAVGLLTVGYVAMARHVPHAATAYALLSHGLGRPFGTAGAAVAVVAYSAIQCSLFGLLGVTMVGLTGGAWWVWAGIAWVAIGLLGVTHVHLSARVLAVTLVAEIAVLAVLDWTAFTLPAGGHVSLAPLSTKDLFVNGVGGVFALGIAAFVGYESGPVFAEEAKTSRTVTRATFATLLFLTVFYAVSAWALPAAVGAQHVVDAARDPNAGLPFSILAGRFGSGVVEVATLLLVLSIFAAMLSFHNTVARYLFALGRERVLPEGLARIGTGGRRSGAPIGGSVLQSVISALARARGPVHHAVHMVVHRRRRRRADAAGRMLRGGVAVLPPRRRHHRNVVGEGRRTYARDRRRHRRPGGHGRERGVAAGGTGRVGADHHHSGRGGRSGSGRVRMGTVASP